jgi:hypothetical protein
MQKGKWKILFAKRLGNSAAPIEQPAFAYMT